VTDDLWQRIAESVGSAKAADIVMTIVQPELIRLRKDMQLWCDAVASAEKLRQYQAADADRYEQQLRHERDEAANAIDRVRALHQHNEDAGYCDLCSNHGDITWPCATIHALDDTAPKPVAEPVPCAECGHPKDQHSEADEPVSVGLCTACDEDGSDDAWHNYEPTGEWA